MIMKNFYSNINNMDLIFVLLVLFILWIYGIGNINVLFLKFFLFLNKIIDDGKIIIDEKWKKKYFSLIECK